MTPAAIAGVILSVKGLILGLAAGAPGIKQELDNRVDGHLEKFGLDTWQRLW